MLFCLTLLLCCALQCCHGIQVTVSVCVSHVFLHESVIIVIVVNVMIIQYISQNLTVMFLMSDGFSA